MSGSFRSCGVGFDLKPINCPSSLRMKYLCLQFLICSPKFTQIKYCHLGHQWTSPLLNNHPSFTMFEVAVDPVVEPEEVDSAIFGSLCKRFNWFKASYCDEAYVLKYFRFKKRVMFTTKSYICASMCKRMSLET